MPSRRQVLLGGAAALGSSLGLGATGCSSGERSGSWATSAPPSPLTPASGPSRPRGTGGSPAAPGPLVQGSFGSTARRGVATSWTRALPPGADPGRPRTAAGAPLPLCVVLHGKGGSHLDLTRIGYHQVLADAVAAGVPPFALVCVDGGNRYWHRRAAGDDSGAMVTDELLPRLAARGLAAGRTDRIAFLGWSMGGYGSLLLAGRRGPAGTAAVVAASPALWQRPQDSAPGAFDDRADYLRNDVWSRRDVLSRIPLRIDCGNSDPFISATRAFVAGLRPAPSGGFGPGKHNEAYWHRAAPAELAFVGARLAAAP